MPRNAMPPQLHRPHAAAPPPAAPAMLLLILPLLLSQLPSGTCQFTGDGTTTGGPFSPPGMAGAANGGGLDFFGPIINSKIQNLTMAINNEIGNSLDFCVRDKDDDWNAAFNFSSDMTFLTSCAAKTGDLGGRLCNAAEMQFYFAGLLGGSGGVNNFLKPNKNCNLSSWVEGCEPGWACSTGVDQDVDIKNSKDIPDRTRSCQPCCEGFFCPRGLTCMIPCPLGAYCPVAILNATTGLCVPYNYQLPAGKPDHICGGADRWADISSSSEIFCPAGYYCPTTREKLPCETGHYCRKGSTTMRRCYKKSSCKEMTSHQDITLFGLLLIAALGLLLLLIYNFSDQILSSRERQQAKSREAAARSAREQVHARERWKTAKDIAKKHTHELQAQLSRTFSRKKSMRRAESHSNTGQARNSGEVSLIPPHTSSSTKSDTREPSSLTNIVHSFEESFNSVEGSDLQNGDKKKTPPKGKEMHTRSQIFKYAYGQIEKEKVMQQQNTNLTFSGVISMATNVERRTRPVIEVAFKDLTLTLKGKRKNLMRCVTGKVVPGHVTAVMGPSGAGKTTFLNALAGKATGCDMSGLVLINGKVESVHSYRKIIGFVPQDDIVHGNLTVEENLWFSACCRLPAEMSKADKVLVVERVIESLGLQAVRDSLVGTVEKRGISGGQRKRVNVGLEMVMEPSLIILDEPTSGLDSASSQLLLRALRREALEGVNIIMVVHQPSYTLYKMFDDLILLAKGGLIAYLGPVKRAEEYFSSLGINIPDRVNPPDYLIDILEGIVKPVSGLNYKQLPVRWMQHNGYPIPSDMLYLVGDGSSSNMADSTATGSEAQHPGGVLSEFGFIIEQEKNAVHHNLSKSKDLSNRKTPGIFKQYKLFLGRVGKQRLRESRIQFVDFLILCLAGVCLGTLAKVSDENFGAAGYTYTVIAVSLLCKIGALRTFSLDKLHYWRERNSGMSSLAYFLAKDTVDHFNTLIKPIVYLSMFYFFNNPRSSILDNYAILVSLVYCVTGIAYWFAIFLQPGSAQLWAVLLPVVLTLIATQQRNQIIKILANLCYPKWALEAFIISNARRYSGVWLITRCGVLMKSGYDIREWGLCVIILFLYGVLFRFIAFFCLITFRKK